MKHPIESGMTTHSGLTRRGPGLFVDGDMGTHKRQAMESRISIIIPVYNEADTVNRTVVHLRDLEAGGHVEILVVDIDTGGRTLAGLKDLSVRRLSAPKGRARQMNHGAAAAGGEILLFLHADTRLPDRALEAIRKAIVIDGALCGAFHLGIQSPRPIYRLIEYGANLRCRLNRIPYGDQAIFFRRDFFRKLGGYRDIPIMEDVDLMRRVKQAGRRPTILSGKVRTSARRWEAEGVVRGTLRNWILATFYRLGVSPATLVRYYR